MRLKVDSLKPHNLASVCALRAQIPTPALAAGRTRAAEVNPKPCRGTSPMGNRAPP